MPPDAFAQLHDVCRWLLEVDLIGWTAGHKESLRCDVEGKVNVGGEVGFVGGAMLGQDLKSSEKAEIWW